MGKPVKNWPYQPWTVSCRLWTADFLLQPRQLVEAVKRGRLVTLRQRGIVEYRIDEVLYRPLENENRLADMQEF